MEEKKKTFPFHYNGEAENYSFYRVPKILFTDTYFDRLSTDAKLLYGLLLDRMQLSLKNGWLDDAGRVFIYYTVESIMEALTCGNKKAGQLLAELDVKKGIGLISRVRQGLGKPDRIYVHKCIVPEMSIVQLKKCQNDMSADVQVTGQEMSDQHANNTEKNKTEKKETNLISSVQSVDDNAELEKRAVYREYFQKNCCFDMLKESNPYHSEELDEILELLVDVCCSKQKTIRISGDDKPIEIVKSRFMKLTYDHIQYVMDCFEQNTTKVRNIKQYLLSSLYNATMTIGSYYTALVHHDMDGQD